MRDLARGVSMIPGAALRQKPRILAGLLFWQDKEPLLSSPSDSTVPIDRRS